MNFPIKIIHLTDVDSTNNYAAKLQKAGKLESGTVILADYQSGGRGQRGNSWHAEREKNLLYTLYLQHDNLSVNDQLFINYSVALALMEYLKSFSLNARIKWPNDIYVDDQKIAGILIENQISAGNISSSIIGIGLNVNQQSFEHLNATSLKNLTGEDYNIHNLALELSYKITDAIGQYKYVNLHNLRIKFNDALYMLHQSATFKDSSGEFEGTIMGTNEQGQLMIRKKDELKSYSIKEVELMK